jgi:hypothetical protein
LWAGLADADGQPYSLQELSERSTLLQMELAALGCRDFSTAVFSTAADVTKGLSACWPAVSTIDNGLRPCSQAGCSFMVDRHGSGAARDRPARPEPHRAVLLADPPFPRRIGAGSNGSSVAHCASVRSCRLVTARLSRRSPVFKVRLGR